MIRDEKLQRIIERAIQSAFVDFPDAKRDGVAENLQRAQRMQDYRNSHPLSSLKTAGYKISLDGTTARLANIAVARPAIMPASIAGELTRGISVRRR